MSNLDILKKDVNKASGNNSSIIAHFNPKELDLMDQMQQGPKRNAAGQRTYDSLWHGLLKHAPIKETFLETAELLNKAHGPVKQKFHQKFLDHTIIPVGNGGKNAADRDTRNRLKAMKELGGAELRRVHNAHAPRATRADHGRFGDTELASIPKEMAKVLDMAIGGRVHNPIDNHPEYFLLAPKLQPLLNMFKTSAASAGNYLKNSGARLATGAKRAGNTIGNNFNKMGSSIRKKITPARFQGAPQAAVGTVSTPSQPQSYRDRFTNAVRNNVEGPLVTGSGYLSGAGSAFLTNRAANAVSSSIPLPTSVTVGIPTLWSGWKGRQKGREFGKTAADALANAAGHVGGGIDYVANSPAAAAVGKAATNAGNLWNHVNPVGVAYRALGSPNTTPQYSEPRSEPMGGLPAPARLNPTITDMNAPGYSGPSMPYRRLPATLNNPLGIDVNARDYSGPTLEDPD